MKAESGWQLIETAPRDGTAILYFNMYGVGICRWKEARVYKDRKSDDPHWIEWDCDDFFYSSHLFDEELPTHWMPLPEPPNES